MLIILAHQYYYVNSLRPIDNNAKHSSPAQLLCYPSYYLNKYIIYVQLCRRNILNVDIIYNGKHIFLYQASRVIAPKLAQLLRVYLVSSVQKPNTLAHSRTRALFGTQNSRLGAQLLLFLVTSKDRGRAKLQLNLFSLPLKKLTDGIRFHFISIEARHKQNQAPSA